MSRDVKYDLVEKAEDLKMLTTYMAYVIGAVIHGEKMPKLVMGFNNPEIMDLFCSLCREIEGLRNDEAQGD